MTMRAALLGMSAAGAIVPSAVLAADRDPRIGTWIEQKGTPSYQGLRRSFEELPNGLTQVNITLDPQGRPTSFAELTCDGQPRPVQGLDPAGQVTLACRTIDARTTAFSFMRNAKAG